MVIGLFQRTEVDVESLIVADADFVMKLVLEVDNVALNFNFSLLDLVADADPDIAFRGVVKQQRGLCEVVLNFVVGDPL